MANWGKFFTLFGVIFLVPGIILMNAADGSNSNLFPPAIGNLVVGSVLLFFGLPRLVKGANPKIYGQYMRPTARARSAWMWCLYFFNLIPLYFPTFIDTNVVDGPPFPIPIIMQNPDGYGWVLPVYITFMVVWLLGGLLSGKYPGAVAVIFNTILTISFMFLFNFGLYMLVWAFYTDVSGIGFAQMLDESLYAGFRAGLVNDVITEEMSYVIARLPLAVLIVIISMILVLRMFKQLTETFASLDINTNSAKVLVSISIFASYLLSLFPVYFSGVFSFGNHSLVVPFVNFACLIIIVIIVLRVISNLMASLREISKVKIIGKSEASASLNFGFTTALFIAVLIIAWMPIFLPLVDQGQNSKNHSAYNPSWNGWSNFREEVEARKYNVMPLQSSLSAISRLDPNKQVVLMIQGPNVFYNPASEIPFFLKAFTSNFSMFICEDHGQGFTLLFEMFVASLGKTPFTFIPNGTVMDNGTNAYWRTPEFPIISNWGENAAPFLNGVNRVGLSYATSLLGGITIPGVGSFNLLDQLGWTTIGMTQPEYSYVDMNGDRMFTEADYFKLDPKIADYLGTQEGNPLLGLAANLLAIGIPLVGSQVVFAAKEVSPGLNAPSPSGNGTYSSRVFVSTDASWLNNELIGIPDFDNMQFGLNTLEWLSCGRDPEDVIVVFDESHIRPEAGNLDLGSAGSFGILHGYVNWLSTNPLISFIYPLLALRTLNNWIPKEQTKKKIQLKELLEAEKKKELLQFRVSSFFAKKINWYRVHKKYKQALQLLHRRIERKLHKLMGEEVTLTPQNVVRYVKETRGSYASADTLRRIEEFFTRMDKLKNNKDEIRDETDFMDMFLEMNWIGNNI
jgi:hypothetical protein